MEQLVPTINQDFQLTNRDKLVAGIANIVDKYSDLIVSNENIKDAKKVIAELRKVKAAINDKRKDDVSIYANEIKSYKKQVDECLEPLDQLIDRFKYEINEVKDHEKEIKAKKVQSLIDGMAAAYNVKPYEIPIKSSWLNKTCKGKKLVNAIAGDMKAVSQSKLRIQQGKEIDNDTGEIIQDIDYAELKVKGTPEQLRKLFDFIQDQGIEVMEDQTVVGGN